MLGEVTIQVLYNLEFDQDTLNFPNFELAFDSLRENTQS